MQKTFLRKRQLAERYGDVTLRTVERAVRAGRLPPPQYPFGKNVPLWDLATIEAHERAAAIQVMDKPKKRLTEKPE